MTHASLGKPHTILSPVLMDIGARTVMSFAVRPFV